MSDEIKVGDRFLVEVEVTMVSSTAPTRWVQAKSDGADTVPVPMAWLERAKRLPRALKVGDRVNQPPGQAPGVIVWNDDIFALVRWPRNGLVVSRLDSLTLAEEAR